ncbi:hypothetical protein AB7008_09600 [Bradyrhizobium sp. 521_C7_N1_3]|uniref:hypothetical protein n=1 Tax=Bradyrhizobium sp. 521_C7_N1_3 TaxID=3240368 RepID=UPI003F888A49
MADGQFGVKKLEDCMLAACRKEMMASAGPERCYSNKVADVNADGTEEPVFGIHRSSIGREAA